MNGLNLTYTDRASMAASVEVRVPFIDKKVIETAMKIDSLGASNARAEISIIKFYCANVLQKVVDYAIQVHGALGVTDDIILSSFYRHERAARIYDGADEVHKTRLARLILKSFKK